MAIGAARVMGFKLMTNFNAPYLAKSIPDFWRRWHISLSTWFKDYLYFSLGGNRVSVPKWYLNILVVFLVSGIWHGASWNFVIWGLLHGVIQVIGLQLNRWFPGLAAQTKSGLILFLYQVWTFVLVTFAWIFFRLQHFSDILIFLRSLVKNTSLPFSTTFNLAEWMLVCFGLLCLWVLDKKLIKKPILGFWGTMVLGLTLVYFFGVFNVKQFIYFQF